MKEFTKKYRGYNPIREYNDLTIKEAFNLELEIYKRLSGNKNFPKLIRFDDNKFTITIEYCGNSVDKLKSLKIDNLDEQINNILTTLEENKINHLDIHESGKNICYKDGIIYLIDFDIAVIDNKPLNKKLESILNSYKDRNIKELIKNILNKKERLKVPLLSIYLELI